MSREKEEKVRSAAHWLIDPFVRSDRRPCAHMWLVVVVVGWRLKISKSYVNGNLLGAVNVNKIGNTFLCGVGTTNIPLPQDDWLALGVLWLVAGAAVAVGALTAPKPTLRVNTKIHFLSTAVQLSSSLSLPPSRSS